MTSEPSFVSLERLSHRHPSLQLKFDTSPLRFSLEIFSLLTWEVSWVWLVCCYILAWHTQLLFYPLSVLLQRPCLCLWKERVVDACSRSFRALHNHKCQLLDKVFTVLRAKEKKKADQQADFWQLEGLEFPLMTVKCCKCFAVNHDVGVCVGSTPLTYSICHHVTHLQFNYQHLSPRELPSFRFLYLLPPAVRVAWVCWSLSQLPQGKGKLPVRYRATMKD